MPGPLLIRADASLAIGAGHVMRMLALAQTWRAQGGSVVLAAAATLPHARARMAAIGAEVVDINAPIGTTEDARETVRCATSLGAAWIAADGYAFGPAYFDSLCDSGISVLAVDDYGHAARSPCDVLLCPGPHARAESYGGSPARVVLAGPRYALLRAEIVRAIPPYEPTSTVARAQRWLVAFGGTDPGNLTERVWDALEARGPVVRVRAVVGGDHPRRDALVERAARSTGAATTLEVAVDVNDIAAEMLGAELAIAAAGGTSVELAALGVPSLLVVAAENQRAQATALAKAGAAWDNDHDWRVDLPGLVDAALSLSHSPTRRAEMSRCGRALVDGRGCKRVATRLAAAAIALAPAGRDDARLLWSLANDPSARAASFSGAPIPWEHHLAWLERRVGDPERTTWIARDQGGRPLGAVRLDPRPDGASEISINVGAEHRGAGIGKAVIRRATSEAAARGITRVAARIKRDNVASLAAFAAADYHLPPSATGSLDDEVVELWGTLP